MHPSQAPSSLLCAALPFRYCYYFPEGSDGKAAATVTVNFGPADFAARSERGGEVILPVWGVLIESPEFVAFHARSWAGRTYESPVLFTVRTESGATRIFHGFGDARIQWGGKEWSVRRESQGD